MDCKVHIHATIHSLSFEIQYFRQKNQVHVKYYNCLECLRVCFPLISDSIK